MRQKTVVEKLLGHSAKAQHFTLVVLTTCKYRYPRPCRRERDSAEARIKVQHYTNASFSKTIRPIWMQGIQNSEGGWLQATLLQRSAFTEALSGLIMDTDPCPTRSNKQISRTFPKTTKASSSSRSKKVSQRGRFADTGRKVTYRQYLDQAKSVASCKKSVS